MFSRLSGGPLEWSLVDSRVIGTVGIVVSHYKWQGNYAGAAFAYEGYMTDIWVRHHGQWLIVSSTADLLPPG